MVGLSGKTVGERMSGRDGELNGKLEKPSRKNKGKVERTGSLLILVSCALALRFELNVDCRRPNITRERGIISCSSLQFSLASETLQPSL